METKEPLYFPEPFAKPKVEERRPIRCIPIGSSNIVEYSAAEFQEMTGLTFIQHLLFDSKETYLNIKKRCKQAIDVGKISARAERLGVEYRREVRGGFVNDVYIKWINNRIGFGLYAGKDFEEGEYIGEYVGLVRHCSYLFANVNVYCFRYPLYRIGFWIYTIDAQDFCNETSFINHSNSPNCDAVVTLNNDLLHISVIANQAIKQDAQLTYDYGIPNVI